MEVVAVAVMGAIIGVAFTLHDTSWGTVRFFSTWIGFRPSTALALSAIGGALVISLEFWLLTALWQALS